MTSGLFIIIAAVLNAVMDLLENENYYRSIFRHLDDRFWYKRESWKHVGKIAGYRPDAWHLAKSGMIICLIMAVVLYEPYWGELIDLLGYGLLWNLSFNIFYNKILR